MWQGVKNIYHLFVAVLANTWYGFPARKISVIGVTGTDGKTTTVSLIYHILNASGRSASMISTVGAKIGNSSYDVGFHVTNPASFSLQQLISKAVKESDYLILEVTSHGLDQQRVFGIPFLIGVLTNITHEHLDYHKTYKNYVHAKVKLLKRAKVSIINRDDKSFEHVSAPLKKNHVTFITYGLSKQADVTPYTFPFESKLVGDFNKYNVLAAIAVCKSLGLTDEEIRKAIESFTPPIGRQEILYNKELMVMIDFAHTPHSFEVLLSTLAKKTTGRLIHVFGAAGKRDAAKRPLMGKASAKYADVIILTAEDPRGEAVEKIMNEIETGILQFQTGQMVSDQQRKIEIFKIADRGDAIHKAIEMAKDGDTVVITGKSHEKSMNYGNGEVSWSEHGVVREALRQNRK